MNIVFFAHPAFLGHQSMPRFAQMLADGMAARGHTVAVWAPEAAFSRLPVPRPLRKWLGYLDQYAAFPAQVRRRLRACPPGTLFVFTDHALGPWLPLVTGRPHAVHCHDFLAQRSALGEIPENPTGWTGRQYQALIRRGYAQAHNFISVSHNTAADLQRFLPAPSVRSEVVYNGLNQAFSPQNPVTARAQLAAKTGLPLADGYLLHVGGNQWYKNRRGVLELYNAWRALSARTWPLLFIGQAPDAELVADHAASPYRADIHFLVQADDALVRQAYAGAQIFLFPSLAEGFGWPIAEAMASGCPVVTTAEAPMTEVADNAGFLIPRRPATGGPAWAPDAARTIEQVAALGPEARAQAVAAGLANARRFTAAHSLAQIEAIYQDIVRTTTAA